MRERISEIVARKGGIQGESGDERLAASRYCRIMGRDGVKVCNITVTSARFASLRISVRVNGEQDARRLLKPPLSNFLARISYRNRHSSELSILI
jgi:hypothetical protein